MTDTNDKIIKAGYYVEVTTWENGADYYKTEVVSGLKDNEAAFLVEYCKAFYSVNAHDGRKKGFGNTEIDSSYDDITEFINVLYLEHKVNPEDNNYLLSDENLDDIIGHWGYGEYYRVVDCVKVYHTPIDLVLTEVQHEFI